MHAVPKAASSKSIARKPGEQVSRLAQIKKAGGTVALPDAGLEYLVTMLVEAGPTMMSGMGPAPLTHGELRAYQENQAIRLSPWEALTLRRLSLEWLVEGEAAKDPDRQPPYTRISVAAREMVKRKLDEALG